MVLGLWMLLLISFMMMGVSYHLGVVQLMGVLLVLRILRVWLLVYWHF
uniref:Uncharacterized protein n=1 Tax=Rhizophora mucronata TaxID=61149 RepID=A0A2P2NKN9_RHIMU